MAFVLDASVAAAWMLGDEAFASHHDIRLSAAAQGILVPALWWFEVRNALLIAERRGRISPSEAEDAMTMLDLLPTSTDRTPDHTLLLRLARTHRLTVYDAAYLEVAVREAVPVATLDRALAAAAARENTRLLIPA